MDKKNIRCNWCYNQYEECELDTIEGIQVCPECHDDDFLMDIDQETIEYQKTICKHGQPKEVCATCKFIQYQ